MFTIVQLELVYSWNRPANTDDLARLAISTAEVARAAMRERRMPEDLVVEIVAEEGSRRWIVRLTATDAAVVFLFYGGVRSSIDYLMHDGRWVIEQARSNIIVQDGVPERDIVRSKVDSAVPGAIGELFRRVESGELSAEEATARALEMLQRAGAQDDANAQQVLAAELARELAAVGRSRHERRGGEMAPPAASSTPPRNGTFAPTEAPAKPAYPPDSPTVYGVVVRLRPDGATDVEFYQGSSPEFHDEPE